MSMLEIEEKDYSDGRTKQAFKDSTDINKILRKAQKTGTISHLAKHGAFYADFANFDFDDAQFALARARTIFEELPSELRREFDYQPGKFFEFVNNPANVDKLPQVLPGLAAPGRQLIRPGVGREAPPEAPSEAQPSVPSPATAEPGGGDTGP